MIHRGVPRMGNYNTATSQIPGKINKPVYEKAIDAANKLEHAMEREWNENYHVLEENLLNVIRKMDQETRKVFLTWAHVNYPRLKSWACDSNVTATI